MFTRILFPTDGSQISRAAAQTAIDTARQFGAGVVAFHAIPVYSAPVGDAVFAYDLVYSEEEYRNACEGAAAEMMKEVEDLCAKAEVPFASSVVTAPATWEAIIKAAKDNKCDLIVMASHGRKGLAGVLLGSETTKVLTHSKVPVLVCR
jgi:nucleotide-binding universal stress UspA family protein